MIRKLPILIFLLVSFFGFSQSQSFYNGLDLTKTGNELFLELASRLKETHNAIPYTGGTDTWTVLQLADENPDNTLEVLLIYGHDNTDGNFRTDRSRGKNERDTGGGNTGKWNREHVYPKSLANPPLVTDDQGPGTDVHNLRPADSQQNSTRSNRKFTDGTGVAGIVSTNGGWYPGDEWKGDVARIILYMYLRYHGDGSNMSNQEALPVNVGFGEVLDSDSNMIDLFLKWNVEDPVSEFEDQRNPIIEGIQGNRNPFIDNPYLATLIWGGIVAEDRWNMGGSDDSEAPSKVVNIQATNIAEEEVSLSWDASTDNEAIFDYLIYLDGEYLMSTSETSLTIEGLTSSTTYSFSIYARDTSSNLSVVSDAFEVTTLEGPLYLIREDFENCSDLAFMAVSERSNKNWTCQNQFGENNSGSMGMNGYQENENSLDWLISRDKIDFDENTGELLSFYTDAAYGNSPLTLEYSSDYNGVGNPSDFTWTLVPNIDIPTHKTGTSTEEVYEFENVNIEAITGQVYIAFRYFSPGEDQTRWTVDSFEIKVENPSQDSDDDGVLNSEDLCPNTAPGATVDANGCAYEQLDDDNDGVANGDDLCAGTPENEEVNADGCGASQLDDDNDGVMNDADLCPGTVADAIVDENGCAWEQLDDDNDGVSNGDDQCENTPEGETANSEGCAPSQLDDDNDSVTNDKDLCNNTPSGAEVDANGCAESQKDDDNDGVTNDIDECPNTPVDSPVNSVGCFSLPASNFTIEITSETCPDQNNGIINITADTSYEYLAQFNETDFEFTSSLTVENIEPGNYELCISVKETTYEQCFNLTIEEGVSLLAKSSTQGKVMTVEIESGTGPFTVFVNDVVKFQTDENRIDIPVNGNDKVVVSTSKSCEGIFEKTFIDELLAYPNPAKDYTAIKIFTDKSEVQTTILAVDGSVILSKKLPVVNGQINISTVQLSTGMYFVKLELETTEVVKIIKE